MEIIFASAIVTLLVQVAKWIMSRTKNKELTRAVVLVGALAVSIIVALILRVTPRETLQTIGQIWLSAIGIYEVGYKVILTPLLERAGLK